MIISTHHYELAQTATEDDFYEAVEEAEQRDLFTLSGLSDYRFLRGIRRNRMDKFAALWVWESREAWRKLWGSVGDPIDKENYPEKWLVWEDEILNPILSSDPDDIDYTAYDELIRADQ